MSLTPGHPSSHAVERDLTHTRACNSTGSAPATAWRQAGAGHAAVGETWLEMYARLFRHCRAAVGSVAEGAEISGYSHSYISRIEHGRHDEFLAAASGMQQKP